MTKLPGQRFLGHGSARLLGARSGTRQWFVEVRDCVRPSETQPYSRGGVMAAKDKFSTKIYKIFPAGRAAAVINS
jgi:hypothetical protein